MIEYVFYELLMEELPPLGVSFKSYKGNELEEASKDFEFIKGFDDYVAAYLTKTTVKGNCTIREQIKKYYVEKWRYLFDN